MRWPTCACVERCMHAETMQTAEVMIRLTSAPWRYSQLSSRVRLRTDR